MSIFVKWDPRGFDFQSSPDHIFTLVSLWSGPWRKINAETFMHYVYLFMYNVLGGSDEWLHHLHLLMKLFSLELLKNSWPVVWIVAVNGGGWTLTGNTTRNRWNLTARTGLFREKTCTFSTTQSIIWTVVLSSNSRCIVCLFCITTE